MSVGLLQLYVEQTTCYVLSTPEEFYDPLIFDVIPLAIEDTLVMNAVLCLGGLPQPNQNDQLEIKRLHHYARALKELKHALTEWNNGSNKSVLRLLLTTSLLCQYEVSLRIFPAQTFPIRIGIDGITSNSDPFL